MFDLQLDWNRKAHTGRETDSHILRVRIIPQGTSCRRKFPVHLAVALDTSSSMAGEKLERAKEACLAVVERLKADDRLWLAAYSTRVEALLTDVAGGVEAQSTLQNQLSTLQVGGVTRMDHALTWIESSLQPDSSSQSVRVGILITDGHATSSKGAPLQDLAALVSLAERVAQSGSTLCSVGMGKASDFNTAFLVELSNHGRGAFLYADTPGKLQPQLSERLSISQTIAAGQARLHLRTLCPDVKVKALCRIRPDYVPLDAPSGNGTVQLGSLRSDAPTDFLLEIEVPPLRAGTMAKSQEVLSVKLIPEAMNAIEAMVSINYTLSFSESQTVNPDVDHDRLVWEINAHTEELHRTHDNFRTAELLSDIGYKADQAGLHETSARAQQAAEELRKSGKPNVCKTTGLLSDLRSSDTRSRHSTQE